MKVLYIDIPFAKEKGGDKNRSRFLWKALSENCEADLLLLGADRKKIDEHSGYRDVFSLNFSKGSGFFPQSIYTFSQEELKRFREIVQDGKYDSVIIRFLSPSMLGEVVEKFSPSTKIIIDVDMLFSRIAELSWLKEKSIKNRFYFFEKYRLKRFEKKVFVKPWDFLFTNKDEMEFLTDCLPHGKISGNFSVLPNVMQGEVVKGLDEGKDILFFGTLNSAANEDAYTFLVEDIYPQIEPVLKKHGVKIKVVGRSMTPLYEKLKKENNAPFIDLVGEVDSMSSTIGNCIFTFLPLRVASGTRTRILEAAALGRAVLTTDIGAEGLDFSDEEVCFAQAPHEMKEELERLLEDSRYRKKKALQLQKRTNDIYSEKAVGGQLMTKISEPKGTKKKVLLVLNRFYPEVGGAETNLYFQANKMVEKFDLTVFSPLRMAVKKFERLNGYRVFRFFDLLNFWKKYPILNQKTFCPGMFFKILFGKYDIIQCFPAVNYNNMLAVLAAKIKGIPIVLCSFDLLDYSGIIAKEGTIDPNILKNYKPDWKRAWFFKQFAHIYAISNREINFYRQYNESVSYSPVPVLLEEYSGQPDNPKEKYGLQNDNFTFLSLGRVSKIKGQDMALDGFIKVADKLPGSRMVFVGRKDYEPEFIERMQAKIAEAKLEDRVVFTGMIEREEVLGWLKFSDIHIIPVRFMNSGAVVVESWASDTPVIQSDAVDPNLVEEGINGYGFKTGDVEELSAKMIAAYESRDKLPQMAEHGKKIVEERYGYDYLIGLYEQKYSELMGD